ncbi:MAG TPA: hypothetical protein VIJ70_10960 [Gaiellaceae bacterium]
MATREQIHKLVDGLPEAELDPVAEILVSRGETESAALGDALEFLRRLDSGEDDGYDFSVSEQLHAER